MSKKISILVLMSLSAFSVFGSDPPQKYIALCFDDGPHNDSKNPYYGTLEVLDILKEKGVKATFFVMGKNIKRFPESFKKTISEGHEIENHTYSHIALTTMDIPSILADLERCSVEIKKYYQGDLTFFRAPFWQTTRKINESINKKFGFFIMNARNDHDIHDWGAKATTTSIYNNAMKLITLDHLVMVVHAEGPERGNKISLKKIINAYKAAGFKFVTLKEYAELKLLNDWH